MNREELIHKLYEYKERVVTFLTRTESIFNRLLLVGVLLIVLLWLSFGTLVDLLVSENRIKINIVKKLEETTGKKAEIGEVNFRKEPEPVFLINKVVIAGDSNLTKENFFEAELIKTTPSILSAILGKTDFHNISFENAKINMGTDAAGGGGGDDAVKNIFSHDELNNKKISFKNLQVNLYKKNTLIPDAPAMVRSFVFPTLNIEFNKSSYSVKGSASLKNVEEPYYFELNVKAKDSYTGRLYSTTSELKFSGKIDKAGGAFDGKMEGKVTGLAKNILGIIGVPQEFRDSIRENEEAKLSADYNYSNHHLTVNSLQADSKIIGFTLKSETDIGEKTNSDITVELYKLNYFQMFKTHFEIISERKAKKIERDFKKKLEEFFLFAVHDDVNFNFTLHAPKINFYNDQVGTVDISTTLKDDQFTINSMKAQLPGESAMSVKGSVTINKPQQQLKGSMRIILAGKNMDELSLALDDSAIHNKEQRFGQFYIDAKGFLYGQNIHFREIVARINEDKFAGQMLIDYSKEFTASAALNFTSLNVDKYIKLNKGDDITTGKGENILAEKLDFLRVIDSFFDRLDLALEADTMTKGQQTYTDFSVYAQIMPGVTEVKNIYFKSDILGQVSGKAHLDLTDFQPKLQVNLELDKYDMDLMMYGELIKQNDVYDFDGKWSNEKIAFDKLGSFQGNLDLKIDEFKFFHYTLKNFILKSHTEEGKFNIDSAKANIFGNKIDFKGYLTTEYPSFNVSFVATDIDAKSLMSQTLGMTDVNSIFNMSGAISGTGYTIEQMVESLKGNLSIASKGFVVNGFDLNATGTALPLVKKREYIKIIADELMTKGQTQFAFFTGVFQIDAGHIVFDDIKLNSANLQDGSISGDIDLPEWKLTITSDFNALTDEKNGVYNIQGKATGNIPDIQTEWDTKGMTKYWEGKFFSDR